MKKQFILTIALFAMGLSVLIGCTTVTDPATGETHQVVDPVKAEKVRAAITPLISGAIRRLLVDNPEKAREIAAYIESGKNVFCAMADNKQFSPSYLRDELDKILAPRIKDDYLLDVKNAVIALYEIQYADRFRTELSTDQWLYQVSRLFCNAITAGLNDANQAGVI